MNRILLGVLGAVMFSSWAGAQGDGGWLNQGRRGSDVPDPGAGQALGSPAAEPAAPGAAAASGQAEGILFGDADAPAAAGDGKQAFEGALEHLKKAPVGMEALQAWQGLRKRWHKERRADLPRYERELEETLRALGSEESPAARAKLKEKEKMLREVSIPMAQTTVLPKVAVSFGDGSGANMYRCLHWGDGNGGNRHHMFMIKLDRALLASPDPAAAAAPALARELFLLSKFGQLKP